MYQYHGWITLRDTASADDEADDDPMPATVEAVRELLARSPFASYFTDVREINVMHTVTLAGMPNHAMGMQTVETLQRVGELAPGSFGLLHVYDDEAGLGYSPTGPLHPDDNNAWFTYVIRRGTVTLQRDTFLSPVIPTLEDPMV